MTRAFTDNFDVNGALAAPWVALSGAASVVSNKLAFTTAPGSNPMMVVPLGLRSNGRADVDITATPSHVYGCALYPRVVDALNWVRVLVRTYQSSYQYYVTETLWQPYRWQDEYLNGKLQREVRYISSCTYSTWSGYSAIAAETGCRDAPQATNPTEYGAYCGGSIKEYRVRLTNATGCVAGKNHYIQEARTRTESPVYSTKWVDDGYALGSNESFTGSTRTALAGGLYTKISTSTSATNPGQTTTATGPYDGYNRTLSVASGAQYYAETQSHPLDQSTGTTRQTGPYTATSTNYGDVVIEQSVAGTITTIASYLTGSTASQPIRALVVDTSWQVYRNGSLLISATCATHKTTGDKIGLGGGASYNATQPTWDTLVAKGLSSEWVRTSAGAWVRGDRKIRVGGTSWVGIDERQW